MIKKFFKNLFKSEKERIEDYLADSVSIYDVERKLKEISLYGFDKRNNYR